MVSPFEYMQFATHVYAALDNNEVGIPKDWHQVDWRLDGFTGFSAGIYKNDQTGECPLFSTYLSS